MTLSDMVEFLSHKADVARLSGDEVAKCGFSKSGFEREYEAYKEIISYLQTGDDRTMVWYSHHDYNGNFVCSGCGYSSYSKLDKCPHCGRKEQQNGRRKRID